MISKGFKIVFTSIFFSFLLMLSSASALEKKFEYPFALTCWGTGWCGGAGTYPYFNQIEQHAFVVLYNTTYITLTQYGTINWVVAKFDITQNNSLDDWMLLNGTTYPTSLATTCNSTAGGTSTRIDLYSCWMDNVVMNGYITIVCTARQFRVGGFNYTNYVKVINLTAGNFNYTETDYTTGSLGTCGSIPFETANAVRVGNLGYGFTGTYERPIFIMDNDGYIHRFRWDGGTVREDEMPALDYVVLDDWQPLQYQHNEATKCFGGWQTYDCGEYIVWSGTITGCSNSNIYVTEYKFGCSDDWGYGGCSFYLEPYVQKHRQKLVGSCTGQLGNIDDWVVWHDGSIFWLVYHETYKRFYNQQFGNYTNQYCQDSECWFLKKYNPDQFDYARGYDNDEFTFPIPMCEWENATTQGVTPYTWECNGLRIPDYYTNLRFRCYGANCNLTITDNSNPSNFYNADWNPAGIYYVLDVNMTQFQGKLVDIEMSSTTPTFRGDIVHPARFIYPIISFGETNDVWNFFGAGRYAVNGTDWQTPDDIASQNWGMFIPLRTPCTCSGWTETGECLGEDMLYVRYCQPSYCNYTTQYVNSSYCIFGGCYPADWHCYNSSHLAYRLANCSWSTFIGCTYGCNATAKACYGTGGCINPCQNPQMAQRPFPDCSCECPNYCLEYLNLSVNCQCSVYPTFGNYSELQINTSAWQENPVSIFADITGGIFSLIGNILIPLIILFLSLGFASIIVIIFKKTVPRI